jgi:hypothetical protein
MEYLHGEGYVHFEIPKWFSLGLIVVIFGISFLYAWNQERKKGPKTTEAARQVIE